MHARPFLPVLGLASAAMLLLAFASPAQKPADKPAAGERASGVYTIDPVHSSVLFRIKRSGMTWFYGAFDKFSGSITADPAKPESSKVSVEIDVDSIDTRNEGRDKDVKGPDFLDAKQFPTASFTSKTVTGGADRKWTVAGDFTLHGVTKPVTIEVEEVGAGATRQGNRAGFFGTLTFQRSDYGLKFMPDAFSEEVQLILSFEAKKGGGERK